MPDTSQIFLKLDKYSGAHLVQSWYFIGQPQFRRADTHDILKIKITCIPTVIIIKLSIANTRTCLSNNMEDLIAYES